MVAAAVPWLTGEVVTAGDGSTGGAGFATPIAATLPEPSEADGAGDAVTPIFAIGPVGGSPALTFAGAAETVRAPCGSLTGTEWL
jgi:hypothetical protein